MYPWLLKRFFVIYCSHHYLQEKKQRIQTHVFQEGNFIQEGVKEESVKSLMLQTDKASIYEMAGNKKIKP